MKTCRQTLCFYFFFFYFSYDTHRYKFNPFEGSSVHPLQELQCQVQRRRLLCWSR